jgi:uncharacterized protein
MENTIRTFDAWLRLLPTRLQSLGHAKNLAFAASCCARALPNYGAFSRAENWGDPRLLADGLESVWLSATTTSSPSFRHETSSLVKAVDLVTPNTENFKSPLTSAALDAATSIAEALEYSIDGQHSRLVTISSLSRDTIDLFIQRRDDFAFPSRERLQPKVDSHPLMLAELRKQQLDVETLEAAGKPDAEFWTKFRRGAIQDGRSSLGLSV